MECTINKLPNFFVVDIQKKEDSKIDSIDIQKKEDPILSKIDSVITTKIKPNTIGATNLKSQLDYNKEDAEVWMFVAGGAPIN